MMGSLAAFAFGAIYIQQKLQDAERVSAAISLTSAMAHHVNNPLQAAMLLLFRLKNENIPTDAAMDLLARLETELDRVAKLSAEIIDGQSRVPRRLAANDPSSLGKLDYGMYLRPPSAESCARFNFTGTQGS